LFSFKRKKPSLVVLMQGYETINAAARAAALQLSIPVLALENTARSDRFLWDNVSGITTNRSLAKNFYWRYKGLIDKSSVQEYNTSYIASIKLKKSEEHTSPVKRFNDQGTDKPMVLFLGQVLTDSSMVFGIGKWETPLNVIKETIDWVKKNNTRLVVKLHPKELSGKAPINEKLYNKLTYRKMLEDDFLKSAIEDEQIIIDHENEFDTYDLIENASIIVTVNSQSGLEALQFKKPVVVCGSAFYDGLGFTLDSHDPRFFDIIMNDAMSFEVPYSAHEFNYIYYEKYCLEKEAQRLVKLVQDQSKNHLVH